MLAIRLMQAQTVDNCNAPSGASACVPGMSEPEAPLFCRPDCSPNAPAQPNQPTVVVQSPLNDPTKMSQLLPVLLDKTTPDVFERFAQAVKLAPEVLECHMVAGGFDYLVKARLPDMTAYRRFLGETLLALPGVRETRTYAVMEEVKRDAPLPV